MNKYLKWIVLISCHGPICCANSKINFNKSRILDATMDPSKTSVAIRRLQDQPANLWERANISGAGSVGGSCPTCGN